MHGEEAAHSRKFQARQASEQSRPPSNLQSEIPSAAKSLCSKGATIAEIANAFGVCIATIWNWKVTYPEFTETCRLGLEAATERVERSIFERAVGYTHESVKIFLPAGASKPAYARYLKHVPPDTRAGEFWLANRRPGRWKNKQNVEHNEATDSPIRLFAQQLMGTAIRPQPQSVTNGDDIAPVTRAPMVTRTVDDDDDRRREPRIHTISQTYQDR